MKPLTPFARRSTPSTRIHSLRVHTSHTVHTCLATTDSTSMSIRLNSSKQAHAPAVVMPVAVGVERVSAGSKCRKCVGVYDIRQTDQVACPKNAIRVQKTPVSSRRMCMTSSFSVVLKTMHCLAS